MRVLIGGVVGGVIMFIWAFVSWMFIPWHTVGNLSSEATVQSALTGGMPEEGVYFVPGMDMEAYKAMTAEQKTAADEAWAAAYEKGPVAMIAYRPGGKAYSMPFQMGIGLGLEIAVALVAAFMLHLATPALPFYRQRVFFVFLLGVFTVFGTHLVNWNYMNYPLRFSLEMAGDSLVMTLLLALVLGFIVKPGGHAISHEIGAI